MIDDKLGAEIIARLDRLESMVAILVREKTQPSTTEYVDIDEAAILSGLSKKTLQNMLASGKLYVRSIKIGKKVLLSRAPFKEWLESRITTTRRV